MAHVILCCGYMNNENYSKFVTKIHCPRSFPSFLYVTYKLGKPLYGDAMVLSGKCNETKRKIAGVFPWILLSYYITGPLMMLYRPKLCGTTHLFMNDFAALKTIFYLKAQLYHFFFFFSTLKLNSPYSLNTNIKKTQDQNSYLFKRFNCPFSIKKKTQKN